MPAKNKPTAAPAPLTTTTAADAHSLMLRGMDRQIERSRAEAKEEAQRAMRQLQRLVEALDAGQMPTSFDGAPDMARLTRELTQLAVTMRVRDDVHGLINDINA